MSLLPLMAALTPLLSFEPTDVPCAFWPCPNVTTIQSAGTTPAYNITFISSGFATDDELELYRCAVDRLAAGLMTASPWKDHACAIGIYRIDARADDSGIPKNSSCSESCDPGAMTIKAGDLCPKSGKSPVLPTLWPESFCGVLSTDIPTEHCVNDVCRLVWPTSIGKAKALAFASKCAPNPSVIVVVANSDLAGGGGDVRLASSSGPLFTVVTIDNIRNSNAWQRLGHEMGHALGLLDEYTDCEIDALASSSSGLAYQCSRNLYSPTLAAAVGCTETNTWESTCTSPGSLSCGAPSSGKCQVVCAGPTVDCSGGTPPPAATCCYIEPGPPIGLWEGGFYKQTEVFRSEEKCIMNNNTGDDLCGRCVKYGDTILSMTTGPITPLPASTCAELHIPHEIKMKVAEDVDLERCGTIPHPHPMPGPGLGGMCPELGQQVLAFRALVKVREVPGLEVEVPVKGVSFTVADPKKPSKKIVYGLSVGSKDGTPVLSWTRRNKAVDAAKVTAVADEEKASVRLGAAAGPMTVIDVTGKSWEATQLIITTVSDAPSAPVPHP